MESAEETTPARKRSANYPLAFKRKLAQHACDENVSVAQLALEHGLNTNMVFKWRRNLRAGRLDDAKALLPVSVTPNAPLEQSTLPDHLPRDEKVYPPPADACPACGGGLRHLGEDVAEQSEYVPASFRVIRHVRPKLASPVAATRSSRRLRRAVQSNTVLPVLVCWRMFWSPILPITCRYIGSR